MAHPYSYDPKQGQQQSYNRFNQQKQNHSFNQKFGGGGQGGPPDGDWGGLKGIMNSDYTARQYENAPLNPGFTRDTGAKYANGESYYGNGSQANARRPDAENRLNMMRDEWGKAHEPEVNGGMVGTPSAESAYQSFLGNVVGNLRSDDYVDIMGPMNGSTDNASGWYGSNDYTNQTNPYLGY